MSQIKFFLNKINLKFCWDFIESVFSYQNISLITSVTYFEAKFWNNFVFRKKSTFAQSFWCPQLKAHNSIITSGYSLIVHKNNFSYWMFGQYFSCSLRVFDYLILWDNQSKLLWNNHLVFKTIKRRRERKLKYEMSMPGLSNKADP